MAPGTIPDVGPLPGEVQTTITYASFLDEDLYAAALGSARLRLGIHFDPSEHPRDTLGRWKGVKKTFKAWHGQTRAEKVKPRSDRPLFIAPEWLAATYAEDHESKIMPVEYEAKNALILDTPEKFKEFYDMAGAGDTGIPLHAPPDEDSSWRRMTRLAKSQGFDAIDIPDSAFAGENGFAWVSGSVGEPQTVLLEPERAKIGKPRPAKAEYPYWEPPS